MKQKTLLFIILMVSFLVGVIYHNLNKKPRDYVDIARDGLQKLAVQYTQEFKLRLVATGGAFHGGLNGFVYRFGSRIPQYGIDSARKIYVTITQGMLDYVNSTEEIRPYLVAYPFPIDEFKVSISYPAFASIEEEEKEKKEGAQRIDYVVGIQGKVCYRRYSLINEEYETVHVEDYEEAKRIVENQISKLNVAE